MDKSQEEAELDRINKVEQRKGIWCGPGECS